MSSGSASETADSSSTSFLHIFTKENLKHMIEEMKFTIKSVEVLTEETKKVINDHKVKKPVRDMIEQLCRNNIMHNLSQIYSYITSLCVQGILRNDPDELKQLAKLVKQHEKRMRAFYTDYRIQTPEYYEECKGTLLE